MSRAGPHANLRASHVTRRLGDAAGFLRVLAAPERLQAVLARLGDGWHAEYDPREDRVAIRGPGGVPLHAASKHLEPHAEDLVEAAACAWAHDRLRELLADANSAARNPPPKPRPTPAPDPDPAVASLFAPDAPRPAAEPNPEPVARARGPIDAEPTRNPPLPWRDPA